MRSDSCNTTANLPLLNKTKDFFEELLLRFCLLLLLLLSLPSSPPAISYCIVVLQMCRFDINSDVCGQEPA